MLPPEVRAIFFDAVGTLIELDPPAPAVYAAVGRRFGSQLAMQVIAQRFRTAFLREEAIDLRARMRTDEQREILRWRRIVAEVLSDVADTAACFRELFDHFSRPQAWKCLPEVDGTLHELANRGYALGIASNYDHRLRSVVAGMPPLQPLTRRIISSEVGWRKPAPEFFHTLLRSVDLTGPQVLLVGDDWDNDYQGALAAGLQAVWFDPKDKGGGSPAVRIRRLSELVQ